MSRSLQPVTYKIKLKKGDLVIGMSGKYKGKTGKVLATHPKLNKVTVEGLNMAKRHVKPNKAYPQGSIIDVTRPLWVSKVAVIDPASKKPSKIGYTLKKDGSRVRVAKRSGKELK